MHIDDNPAHPTLVFFQDSDTRCTVAVERETGRIVGWYPIGNSDEIARFAAAVRAWWRNER